MEVIRADSSSTFPSAVRTAPWSSGRRRASSAYPAIVVSGVRSSCEASATNCRTCCSLRWRSASEISTCTRRVLRAEPTWPTSVRTSVSSSGTRGAIAISPSASGSAATVLAVAAT